MYPENICISTITSILSSFQQWKHMSIVMKGDMNSSRCIDETDVILSAQLPSNRLAPKSVTSSFRVPTAVSSSLIVLPSLSIKMVSFFAAVYLPELLELFVVDFVRIQMKEWLDWRFGARMTFAKLMANDEFYRVTPISQPLTPPSSSPMTVSKSLYVSCSIG